MKACRIDNCERQHHGRGLCKVHYNRLARTGNPMGLPAAAGSNGMTPIRQAWIEALVLTCDAPQCIEWPFSRSPNGYGRVNFERKRVEAHRAVCRMVHGEPKSPELQAAHSCGNGHLGCVNPLHLSWKSPAEQAADTRRHRAEGKPTEIIRPAAQSLPGGL